MEVKEPLKLYPLLGDIMYYWAHLISSNDVNLLMKSLQCVN